MDRAKKLSVTILALLWSCFTVAAPRFILSDDACEISFAQTERLAEYCGPNLEHPLAFRLLDRFVKLEQLEAALKKDASARRRLLIKLYVLNREAARSAVRSARPEAVDFMTQWRAQVRHRLARHMPAPTGRGGAKPDLDHIAFILKKDRSAVSQMPSGFQYLPFEDARKSGRTLNLSPEWILAYEMTSQFESVAHLERTIANEAGRWRRPARANRQCPCHPERDPVRRDGNMDGSNQHVGPWSF